MINFFCSECFFVKECKSNALEGNLHCELNLNYVGLESDNKEQDDFVNSALQAM